MPVTDLTNTSSHLPHIYFLLGNILIFFSLVWMYLVIRLWSEFVCALSIVFKSFAQQLYKIVLHSPHLIQLRKHFAWHTQVNAVLSVKLNAELVND